MICNQRFQIEKKNELYHAFEMIILYFYIFEIRH